MLGLGLCCVSVDEALESAGLGVSRMLSVSVEEAGVFAPSLLSPFLKWRRCPLPLDTDETDEAGDGEAIIGTGVELAELVTVGEAFAAGTPTSAWRCATAFCTRLSRQMDEACIPRRRTSFFLSNRP
jgi:hypothetical protein